ncbi:MAG: helix-hairpin-helix domain-containing protein [Prevotella sp.]|jgi:competence ComEA-like helix-hairpin-helix protein|nr:helix-hairpin-helix domain-containing protein [Prevotella sp.]
MSWKDYFYFQKKDKVAVIILLVLISISGSIYIITEQTGYGQKPLDDSTAEREFALFISQLEDKEFEESVGMNYHPYPTKLKQGETIELNKADTSALKRIPGIGSAYANRIVKYRSLLGGFHNISQLGEVWGIDTELLSNIMSYIIIRPEITQLEVNSAGYQELLKHPYLNKEQVKVIIDIRERKGKIESIDRLSLLEEFTENDIKRLKNYLSFN